MQISRVASLPLVALLGLCTFTGCKDAAPPPAPPPPEVLTLEVAERTIRVPSEYIGTLQGTVDATVSARVPGKVQTIDYVEGSFVKKGDPLFTIEPEQGEAAVASAKGTLAQAKAAFAKANADVKRFAPLVKTKAISQQELDNAIAERDAAKASIEASEGVLEGKKLDLSYTKVTSPIDGITGIRKVSIGDLVGFAGPTALTVVSKLDPIECVVTISEQQFIKAAPKLQNIAAFNTAHPEGYLQLVLADGSVHPELGKLTIVDRQINVATGALTLKAQFPNTKMTLRPGQFARVRVQGEERQNIIVIPQRAVMDLQGMMLVAVLQPDGTASAKPVKTSESLGPLAIITEGLKVGDRIVVEGMQKARPGVKLSAKPAPANLQVEALLPETKAPAAAPVPTAPAAADAGTPPAPGGTPPAPSDAGAPVEQK